MVDSSPLPRPSDLEAYERIVPGSAKRILMLVERRAEQDAWVERKLAREERLIRLLTYGSALFGALGAAVGSTAFLWKFFAR